MNQDVVSFVLRFIREDGGASQPARWRGVIKHVQSDHSADFTHFGDALQFMQAHVDEAIRQAFVDQEPLTPENILAETTRLWGEVAPRYTDFMLQSMEAMLDQGRRFAENMTTWGQPPEPPEPPETPEQRQQARMLDVMERLAVQVETLTDRVEQLEARLRDE
jgi:polyhydroxyalkanoate synthesis regulator phasin